MEKTTPLRLVHGDRATRKNNGVTVSIVDQSIPLTPVSVRVFEEDTHLVLTKEPVVYAQVDHPIRVMTGIMDSKPHKPGTLVMEQHWYAVVLDLDAEALCRESWVQEALKEIFWHIKDKRVSSLSLPLLGNVHGTLSACASLQCIFSALSNASVPSLQRLQIEAPKTFITQAIKALHDY